MTLSWIPLGAGQHLVRVSGMVFEALCAARQRRHAQPLSHSALEITVAAGRFTIEMAPIPDTHGQLRGVVAEGPVGTRWAGRFRVFRYEIRRWRDGVIPDARHATSTVVVGVDVAGAERLLDLVPSVPTAVWGRDELDAGEMWNSNSVTSWLLARSRFDTSHLVPPAGGRAPGWRAGLIVAARAVAGCVDPTIAGDQCNNGPDVESRPVHDHWRTSVDTDDATCADDEVERPRHDELRPRR